MIGEEKGSVAISGRYSHKMTGLFSEVSIMARQVKVLMDGEINRSFKETSIGEKRLTGTTCVLASKAVLFAFLM